MNVTKVVGFDLRIPKHFSLHFYDFSTILYGIYKFAVFENKRKRKGNFVVGPLEDFGGLQSHPWPDRDRGGGGRPKSGELARRR